MHLSASPISLRTIENKHAPKRQLTKSQHTPIKQKHEVTTQTLRLAKQYSLRSLGYPRGADLETRKIPTLHANMAYLADCKHFRTSQTCLKNCYELRNAQASCGTWQRDLKKLKVGFHNSQAIEKRHRTKSKVKRGGK